MAPSRPPTLLPLLVFLLAAAAVVAQRYPPRVYQIDCGATGRTATDSGDWLPDAPYVTLGNPRNISVPNGGGAPVLPALSTARAFPYNKASDSPRKSCYSFLVVRRATYLVRTTYYYGGAPGEQPPVFDQVVDGTVWTTVNTTGDYGRGMASVYEGVYAPPGKFMSLCLAGNVYTDSDPFINAIELVLLEGSVYNATNFTTHALALVSRSNFGYDGAYLRYPDDQFDRYWQPFMDGTRAANSSQNISVSGFWNLPPSKIFETSLVAENEKPLELQWPLVPLPNSSYYIVLYFAESSLDNSRVFDVYVNEVLFSRSLSVQSTGVSLFATNWPLSGATKIRLVPSAGSSLPPLINGGEIFGIMPLGGVTNTRDVIGLEAIKKNIQNPPVSWSGDPCLPREYAWSGVLCSEGSRARVVALNLTGMRLFGTLSPNIANLTAVTDILLGDNGFSGPIPDLSQLQKLVKLHLQGNQFSGVLPATLGNLPSLRELYVQNNNLSGDIPSSVSNKPGLDLKTFPGNQFNLTPRN